MAESNKSKIKPLTEEEAGKAVGGQQPRHSTIAVELDRDVPPSRPTPSFPGTISST